MLVALVMIGCATTPASPTAALPMQASPLTPIQAAVTVGVFLEDLNKTQEEDDREVTILELLSDVLSTPYNLTVGMVAMVGGLVWSLTSLTDYHEGTLQQHAATIQEWFPMQRAAPAAYYDPKPRHTVRTP